jgi:hypothetical protein
MLGVIQSGIVKVEDFSLLSLSMLLADFRSGGEFSDQSLVGSLVINYALFSRINGLSAKLRCLSNADSKWKPFKSSRVMILQKIRNSINDNPSQ